MISFKILCCYRSIARSLLVAVAALGAMASAAAATPSGRAVMAFHVTISPSWFDPSTAPPQITPFGVLYAIHDALVRPYPGHKMGPSLAESWQESADGKTYEFKLRPGLKFHNGDSADDGGRQVQLRALQGRVGKDPAGQCRQHRDRRSAGGALSSQGAVARLHDDLRHDRQRRRHRRAEEIPHTGRGGRLQEAPDRRRPLQIRQPEAGLGGRAGGQHRLLAPRAQRQDPGD